MTWQEYQEAVALLYDNLEEMGEVKRNIRLPDKVTGQLRQIDVWVELTYGEHVVKLLIDAKKYNAPLDVKDIEAVVALGNSVGANKTIIVTNGGWTHPAETKASFESCDLMSLSIDEALELLVPDKWELCPTCQNDCIVMDQSGAIPFHGLWIWWLAGQCRECRTAKVHCQDCGIEYYIEKDNKQECSCGHVWTSREEGIELAVGKGDHGDDSDNGDDGTNDNPNQYKIEFN